MDAGSTRFERALVARLKEHSIDGINAIASGAAFDFAEYRERVGYLRAFGDVLKIIDDISAQIDGEQR